MNIANIISQKLNRHMPMLIAVMATGWTAFALCWTLHAVIHPLV
ncbi:MAG: hypothetical protein WA777_21580 [Rhodanobacter sp.]